MRWRPVLRACKAASAGSGLHGAFWATAARSTTLGRPRTAVAGRAGPAAFALGGSGQAGQDQGTCTPADNWVAPAAAYRGLLFRTYGGGPSDLLVRVHGCQGWLAVVPAAGGGPFWGQPRFRACLQDVDNVPSARRFRVG